MNYIILLKYITPETRHCFIENDESIKDYTPEFIDCLIFNEMNIISVINDVLDCRSKVEIIANCKEVIKYANNIKG